MRKQEPPFSVQVELVEGCNLYCSFCGLQGIRTREEKNLKFADMDMIDALASQIEDLGWTSRIEIAMHGEPTLHPVYATAVRIIRSYLPNNQIMMTSNGGGLLSAPGPEGRIRQLFNSGLNILALDDYQGVHIVEKVRRVQNQFNDIVFREYPADPLGNPHRRWPRGTRMVTYMQDISVATSGTHARLVNHAGAAAPRNNSCAGKRCHRPFREIAVRWDGNVAVCCNDWRGEYRCGNVVTNGLEAVWQGQAFNAARQKLYHGQRDFGPCRGCDAVSYRVGFLPDPSGRETLPEPDWKTSADVAKAMIDGPYTQPILREWEK